VADGRHWEGLGVADADLADIYQRYRQGLFTLALSIVGCPLRAEDAVHDAFARLCRQGTDAAENRVAYVFAAVRNAALDQVRRARSTLPIDFASSVFDWQWGNPERAAMDDERQRSIARAIDALPDDQREAVVLRVYAGLNFAQIAIVLDAPMPTVFARYRRALARLKGQLERLV
jgi:RNA polymerase sigma-70 factor (ECF subfamily)